MFGHICIKRIVLGALVGIVTTAVLLFISAVVLCFTPVPDTAVELMSVVATVIGLLTGGAFSSARAENRGWLNGGIAGFFYILILCMISLFVLGNPGIVKLLITVVIGFVTGATGGIAGINMKAGSSRKKRR